MKAKLITALLVASMIPAMLKAQTSDEAVIRTTSDTTEWTTGKITTPRVRWSQVGLPLSISFNDLDSTVADGAWRYYDISDNLLPFDPFLDAYGLGTYEPLDSTIAEQPILIRYMLADSLYARHGVGAKIDREIDSYWINAVMSYTDTVSGEPADIQFRMPNLVYKYVMGLDTSAPTPFRELHGYDLNSDPDSLDMALKNLYQVMVNPGLAQNRENQAQMNEGAPYDGRGDSINSTIEMISKDGIDNPFDPSSITFEMIDYSDSKSAGVAKTGTGGPELSEVDEGDLETLVFETAQGTVTVKYLMPDSTVTYPGALVVNIYEITVDSGFEPELQVYGLPATITMNQLNDTVYDVAVALQTPDEEGRSSTYDISVDFDAVPVGIPELPKKDAYAAMSYPNPFLDKTTIEYTLENEGTVKIALYDMSGRKLEDIFDGRQVAGTHEFSIDGSGYESGLYFLQIVGPEGAQTVRMVKK